MEDLKSGGAHPALRKKRFFGGHNRTVTWNGSAVAIASVGTFETLQQPGLNPFGTPCCIRGTIPLKSPFVHRAASVKVGSERPCGSAVERTVPMSPECRLPPARHTWPKPAAKVRCPPGPPAPSQPALCRHWTATGCSLEPAIGAGRIRTGATVSAERASRRQN